MWFIDAWRVIKVSNCSHPEPHFWPSETETLSVYGLETRVCKRGLGGPVHPAQRQDLVPEQTGRAAVGWSAIGVRLPERGSQPPGYVGSVFICLLSGASTDLFVWRQKKKKTGKKHCTQFWGLFSLQCLLGSGGLAFFLISLLKKTPLPSLSF